MTPEKVQLNAENDRAEFRLRVACERRIDRLEAENKRLREALARAAMYFISTAVRTAPMADPEIPEWMVGAVDLAAIRELAHHDAMAAVWDSYWLKPEAIFGHTRECLVARGQPCICDHSDGTMEP